MSICVPLPSSQCEKLALGTNPAQTTWVVDRSVHLANNDYAIVARFTDADTGKPTVVIAGIGRGGTIVAGEFLTDSSDLD